MNEQDFCLDRNLYRGRPEDADGRCEAELHTYEVLEELGIPFERVDHEAAFTMEACEEVDRVLGVEMCKNLFLTNAQKSAFYLLMLPGKKVFKTKYLSKQIGSARLSFAGEEYMRELLGVTPGSATVLALMNDKEHRVRLLIDEDLLKEDYVGCHPCINTSSLRLKTRDLLEIFLPAAGHEPIFVELPWEP